MTAVVVPGTERPLATWLIGLYIVALLAFPTDFGLRVGGVVLTPSRVVLLAALIVALVQWRSVLAAVRGVPPLIWIGWAAFLGTTAITALIAPSAAAWARYGSLVGEGLVLFVLVVWAASTPGGPRALAMVFCGAMAAVAGVVLLLAALGYRYDHILADLAGTVYAPDALPRYGLERQPGPFRSALYFAIWMTAASALLLPAIVEGARRTRWLALGGWALLLVAVVLLTTSRLTMTTIFLLPAAYFLIRGPRVVGVASLAMAVAVAFSLTQLAPSTQAIVESGELRLAAIGPALQAIGAQPLFGWGLLSDSTVLSDIIGSQNAVDDTYISLAVETGLVGLGAFLLLAAGIVLATRRGWPAPLGLALAISVASVLAMAVFASVFQITQGYAAFIVLCALALSAAVRAGGRGQPAAAT